MYYVKTSEYEIDGLGLVVVKVVKKRRFWFDKVVWEDHMWAVRAYGGWIPSGGRYLWEIEALANAKLAELENSEV